MADFPKLAANDLRHIVTDADELAKGAFLFDSKGLNHLARFENKIFAEAQGSGASPYKVQILFDEKPKGRCSCMAARSRPFCKHATALLVAWARAPEGFAVAESAPVAISADGKRKSVKKGAVDEKMLIAAGIEQMGTLLMELGLSGVAALSAEKANVLRGLAENLRENKLRRLSARTLELADCIETATTAHASFDVTEYVELFCDAVLTVRKLEKHIAGEPLDDKYVEELIGKTWSKKDRKPIEHLQLIEYAFGSRTTPDNFSVRESRFIDVSSGLHYCEKQILPQFLVAKSDPKKSYGGLHLNNVSGSVYPSFAPQRIDIENVGTPSTVNVDASENNPLNALLQKSVANVSEAIAAFQEHRKDVFAPLTLPISILCHQLVSTESRLQLVDEKQEGIFLSNETELDALLASALTDVKLRAIIGDLALDGALPTLYPLAVVVETSKKLNLISLGAKGAEAIQETRKVKLSDKRKTSSPAASTWAEVGRKLGASEAAIALGEVREELAQVWVMGLGALTPRFAEPLATKLKELSLAKQAQLLEDSAQKTDSSTRLDDVVKLYRVLGIALSRLAGVTHLDLSAFVEVPTSPSVKVKKRDQVLELSDISQQVARGKWSRYEGAYAYTKWFEHASKESLNQSILSLWADGRVSTYVAQEFARRPDDAIAAAKKVLVGAKILPARTVRLTALRVLEAVANDEAELVLKNIITKESSARSQYWWHQATLLEGLARRSLKVIEVKRGKRASVLTATEEREVAELTAQLLNAGRKEERESAGIQINTKGYSEAFVALRASMRGDIATDVRAQSAYALARMGDSEALSTFIEWATVSPDAALRKVGLRSIGTLGDIRGVKTLIDVWEANTSASVATEAIGAMGGVAIQELLSRIETNESLVKRAATADIFASMTYDEILAFLSQHMAAWPNDETLPSKMILIVSLLTKLKFVAGEPIRASDLTAFTKNVGANFLELHPKILEKKDDKIVKALLKKMS